MDFAAREGLLDAGLKMRSLTLPDTFIDQAAPAKMYDMAGLNADDIEAACLKVLGIEQLADKRA